MTFVEFLNSIEVNGPDYRGAPYPKRRPDMINEEEIPDKMRLKSLDYEMDYDSDDDRAELFWRTQEDFDDHDFEIFIGEVERAINYLLKKKDYEEPFALKVIAECRSGSEWGHGERWLTFNGADNPEETSKKDFSKTEESLEEENHEDETLDEFKKRLGREPTNQEYKDWLFPKMVSMFRDYKDRGYTLKEIEDEMWDAYGYQDLIDKLFVQELGVTTDEMEDEENEVKFWIEYGNSPKDLAKTELLSIEEITPIYSQFVDNYNIARVHSTDNDESARYNF